MQVISTNFAVSTPQESQRATLVPSTRAVSLVGKPESARAHSERVTVMATGPNFLTVAEVAAQMRVSKMTVYRLVHAGDLEAVRVRRSFRVPEKAVEEYLGRSYFQAG